MSSIFDRSIISVPVYDAVYQRNTGRVPSIYFRRTHRQKGESRGKFNLFIAGSKRLPSPSTSLPAHEVVVSLVHVYLFLCPSSPPLSPSLSLLEPDSRSLFLPSSVAYHCSTNERRVPCKEGRKGLCDAAQLARAISQQWFSLSLSVSLKGVSLSFFLSRLSKGATTNQPLLQTLRGARDFYGLERRKPGVRANVARGVHV